MREIGKAEIEAKNRLSEFSLASNDVSINSKDPDQKLSTVRPDAIFNAGRAYIAQTALYWRSGQINALLDTKHQSTLDQMSFRPLIENEFVLVRCFARQLSLLLRYFFFIYISLFVYFVRI